MNNICNLNIVVKKKGLKNCQLLGFLSSVTLESYKTNGDAEGVYFSGSNKLIKGEDKINICLYPKSIMKSKFILTHQRISTSGKTKEFAQPFQCKEEEFVLIHNGIIDDFKEGEASDTYGYFYNHFLVKFKEFKGSREKRIIKSIKETLKGCSGSYSIAIYDTKKQQMYYFKNYSRMITFFKADDDSMLYITTRDSNKVYLSFFYRPFSEINIENKRIYKISVGKKIEVKRVGKIPESPTTRTKTKTYESYTYNGGYGNRQTDIRNLNRWERERDRKALERQNKKGIHDIFQATGKPTEEENKKHGIMFNNMFTKKKCHSLEEEILDEALDDGFSLRENGFTINRIPNQECGYCYVGIGEFRNDGGVILCSLCLREERDNICLQLTEVNNYMNYMGVMEYEDT